jgi:threonine aldolase
VVAKATDSDRVDDAAAGGVKDKLSRFQSGAKDHADSANSTKLTDDRADVRLDDSASGGVKSKLSRFIEKADEASKPIASSNSVNVAANARSKIDKFNGSAPDKSAAPAAAAAAADKHGVVLKTADENDRPDKDSSLAVKDKLKRFELLSPRDGDATTTSAGGAEKSSNAPNVSGDVKAKLEKFASLADDTDSQHAKSSNAPAVSGDVKAKLEKFSSAPAPVATSAPPSTTTAASAKSSSAAATAAAPVRLILSHPNTQNHDTMSAAANAIGADLYGVGTDLNAFESDVASLLRKEKARFFISGIMAQHCAVFVARETRPDRDKLALHPRAHHLIHEQDAVQHVLRMEPLLVGESARVLTFADVRDACGSASPKPAVLIVELPQRELGGQLPSLEEVRKISRWAKENDVHLHLDGARLWQCEAAYDAPLHTVAALFDSVYVSFYKDLGSPCAGAMLLGSSDFIARAAIWQRRMGGSIFTMFPITGAAQLMFKQRRGALAKSAAHAKLVAAALDDAKALRGFLSIVPRSPPANMFHIEFADDADAAALVQARDKVLRDTNVQCFASLRDHGPQPRPLHLEVNIGTNSSTYAPTTFVNAFVALREAYDELVAGNDKPAKSASKSKAAVAAAAAADSDESDGEVAGGAEDSDDKDSGKLAFSFKTDFRKTRDEQPPTTPTRGGKAAEIVEEDDSAARKKEAARKKAEEEAEAEARKKQEAADKKKKADDDAAAAKKRADEKKKEEEEAAKKKKDDEAKKKKEDDEAAKKKKDDDAAAKKKKEEEEAAAAKKKKEDDAAAKKKKEEEEAAAAKKKKDEEAAAKKKKEEEEEAAAAKKKKEDEEAKKKKAEDEAAEEAAQKKKKAEEAAAARIKKEEEEIARKKADEAEAAKKKEEVDAEAAKKTATTTTAAAAPHEDILSPRSSEIEVDLSDLGDVSPTTRRRVERERRREQRQREQEAFERELEEQRVQRQKEREARRKALGI